MKKRVFKNSKILFLLNIFAIGFLAQSCGKNESSSEGSEVQATEMAPPNTSQKVQPSVQATPSTGTVSANGLNSECSMNPEFHSKDWKPCPKDKIPQPVGGVYHSPFEEYCEVPLDIAICPDKNRKRIPNKVNAE
jgi:hypothetical protein